MKRAALVLLAALVLGGAVGVLVARDPGYVLIAYQNLAVETSLWLALLLLVAGYLVMRLAIAAVLGVVRGGGSLKGWNERRRTRATRDQIVRGHLLMAEARWPEARKLLESSAPRAEAPLVNYLGAARAAHEQGDTGGRDLLLKAAHESTPGSRFAVGLVQAELQQAQRQWDACLATLLNLYRQSPRHPKVLRMLAECYRQLEDWQAILELVPEIEKHAALPAAEMLALQLEAWQGRLAIGPQDPETLWQSVPKALRRQPALVAAFARAMLAAGQADEAEALLRVTLEQALDPELLRLYGVLISGDPVRQRSAAEGWLRNRPDDPELLLAVGRISLKNREWSKAREYLETAARLRRDPEIQGELGRLNAALGDGSRAGELLLQALGLPPLPLPERPEAGDDVRQTPAEAVPDRSAQARGA